MDNAELLKRLMATFRLEAEERLASMSDAVLALEQQPEREQRLELIEQVFREAHSLKGASRAVNLTSFEAVCQSLESVLAELKRDVGQPSQPLLELLGEAISTLGALAGAAREEEVAIDGLLDRLRDALTGTTSPARAGQEPGRASRGRHHPELGERQEERKEPPPEVPVTPEAPRREATGPSKAASEAPTEASAPATRRATTVRVSVQRLESALRQVEGLIVPRQAAGRLAGELAQAAAFVESWRREWSALQGNLRQAQRALTDGRESTNDVSLLIDYLMEERSRLRTLEEKLSQLSRTATRDERQLSQLTTSLHDVVKELNLMPFSSLLDHFPRLARDLAREQGKDARLVVEGGDIEVDRRLLDELLDPLTHLVRNAIDHGIEHADVRAGLGKQRQGRVTIAVSQPGGGRIVIRVSDDGAGIDTSRLRELLAESRPDGGEVDERELLWYAFDSGVTTKSVVTEISGRGLGLAIVREKVEQMGGSVEVDSVKSQGTAFNLIMPLSLATFQGVVMRVAGQRFVVPSTAVNRVLRFEPSRVREIEGRSTLTIEGRSFALLRLAEMLGLTSTSSPDGGSRTYAVVLEGPSRIAVEVDEINGQQEVLVKPLGSQLVRVPGIAGASVLTDGSIAPVLNIAELVQRAGRPALTDEASQATGAVKDSQRRILVVEDSVTSRSLLKGILESAGYRVATAVDGVDAFTALRTEPFDLIVSDVDMPRMSGLELAAKVRSDHRLAEVPIILVTSLASKEDRERGVEAGANAYIVKSGFDQGSLLDAVRRLLG